MADTNASLPLLPAHIEETIRSIARLHARHYQNATPLQRVVDRTTALLGRPRSIGVLTVIAAGWISLNLLAAALGYRPIPTSPTERVGRRQAAEIPGKELQRSALQGMSAHATSRLFRAVIFDGGSAGSWSFNCRTRSN